MATRNAWVLLFCCEDTWSLFFTGVGWCVIRPDLLAMVFYSLVLIGVCLLRLNKRLCSYPFCSYAI